MNAAAIQPVLSPSGMRLALILCATLIFCSCSSAPKQPAGQAAMPAGAGTAGYASLPPSAYTGPPELVPGEPPGFANWRPPGIAGPWPREEYLRDGGDYARPAKVYSDWSVEGIEQEDTIAHFDTLDGRSLVQPSNRVHIYAPRFGAVRRVDTLRSNAVHLRAAGYEYPMKLNLYNDTQIATTAVQPIQPEGQIGSRPLSMYRERQQAGGLENRQMLSGFEFGFLAHENFDVIRRGIFDQADKARLATHVDAAIVWSHDLAVQVILDGQSATEVSREKRPEQVFIVDEPNHPQLRIIKVASTSAAKPGDTVDFTLRFDNVGDQVIGNVVVIDNLSTRLEYVPESQQCSLAAEFVDQPNQGGSLALRWEIQQPLKPGAGGIIRFRCKVR